ncbi:PAS domain-containing protein [Haloferax sp. MBLA0076]|uniref:PAS domain-containing protein n=1 Tax=Haloferax litoreum TaxID=2666140 RepID=A0A6A8GI23_9EURY|nr:MULTISPECIES: PAS domain-containing protein [Haloferax]KAB1193604.1 PAS domain-containing protein [Haloferax sp. CBA1148]MRX22122.1 PAS domain-containing protein [Haloferax litoreum]
MGDASLIERGFDELPAEIALLDTHGDIIYTNRAWRMFAETNGYVGDVDAIGVNYLDVCEAARDEDETAGLVADGIRALLRGQQDLFAIEYPCHSPTVYRWFMMRAVPFDTPRHGRFVLVMHLDITERRLAELQVNEKNQHLAMLAHVLSKDLKEPLTAAIEKAGRLVAKDAPDASSLSKILSRIDAIIEQSVTLADQVATLELEPVDFREYVETEWEAIGNASDIDFRVTGGGVLAADEHLFGLFLSSLFTNNVRRSSVPGYPSQIVVGATIDGFYVDDDGPRPTAEERAAATGRNQLLGVDYDSVELSVTKRIADLHGWDLDITESELGGARFEVRGITWR